MNWYFIFYLFSLADKIEQTMNVLSIIGSVISGITLLIWFFSAVDGDSPNTLKFSKRVFSFMLPVTVISWFLWAAVPDRQDMLLIIAGGAVGEFVSTDENARELPADITRFLRKEIIDATLEDGNEILKDAIGIESEKDKLMKKSQEELVDMLLKENKDE